MNQLQLHALKGNDITPYIDKVSEFRVKYFREYKEIDPIFKRKGYTKTPIEISFTYPTVLPDGRVSEEEHPMIYWVKNFK